MSATDVILSKQTGEHGPTLYYRNKPVGRIFAHPWYCAVARTGDGWDVQIKPGFVNGIAPIVQQKVKEKRIKDGVLVIVEVLNDIGLLDGPVFKIEKEIKNFIGTATPMPFFVEMGAVNPSSGGGVMVGDSGVQLEATNDEGGGRKEKSYLLQTVIYLSIARATHRLETVTSDGVLTGDFVDYKVTYDTRSLQTSGQLPRIQCNGVMPEQAEATGLLRGFEDSGFDQIEIATVYYVSPKGFAASQEKDATPQERGLIPGDDWEVYVAHNLFWNLFYQMKTIPPVNLPGGLLDLTTAAFTGRYTVAAGAIAGAINAQLNEALAAAFNDTSNRGRFWTA